MTTSADQLAHAYDRSSVRARSFATLAVMCASGFAGLGYQIVWTQQAALSLGHESSAVLATVTAFFSGLGIGASLFGSRIERSARPAHWYAGCELVLAIWSLLLTFAMPAASEWLLKLIGIQTTPIWYFAAAFVGMIVLLLPATAAMGATLPAMERVLLQLNAPAPTSARSIAHLYACNTAGAVVGVLAIAFWLAPSFGFTLTAQTCVALNLACAGITFALSRRSSASMPAVVTHEMNGAKAFEILLAATGFLGIGYEVIVIRVLSQVAENTVYTLAMVLAVYLVGTAIGAAVYARVSARSQAKKSDEFFLTTVAAACLLGTACLWVADAIKTFASHVFGHTMSAAIAAEAVIALFAFGPATIAMGALFSRLTERANHSGLNFGRSIGLNTLGAAFAPIIFGVLAYPQLGPKLALVSIVLGYLALTAWLHGTELKIAFIASAAFALAVFAPPLEFINVPEGGRVVSYREGIQGSVSIVEDADGVARLQIDNRQQEGSSATLRVDARQAVLPALLHPAPHRALFLGLGTGVTATAAAQIPGLEVDAVELLPEVIDASTYFKTAFAVSANRPRLIAADARRYVRSSEQFYDLIVSDNFHPARGGSGSLYTVEHFRAVRMRLASDGVFCQWLPLHQLDLETLRSIAASFLEVFPDGLGMLASNSLETPVIGLIGRNESGRMRWDTVRTRLATATLPPVIANLGIEDEYALLGSFIAGPAALRHFVHDAAVNTDDHPVVAYRAPRMTYAPDSLPRDRLAALLDELRIDPNELLESASDEVADQRLAAYWIARKQFIESGRHVRSTANVYDMLAQVREPLIEVLRVSPDFRPAYDPLFRMAQALATTDASGARSLLRELATLQPRRDEARLALHALAGSR